MNLSQPSAKAEDQYVMMMYGVPDSIRCGMERQNHNQKNRRNGGVLIITAILMLSISALILSELCYLNDLKRIDRADRDLTGDFVQFYLQHEDVPFDIEFSAFSDLYRRLTQMEYAEYFEIYNQYLSDVPDELFFYEEFTEELQQGCEAVRCVQISSNVFEQFHLSIKDGRIWSEDEITIHSSGDTIPVLLGADYGNIYEVGDIFTAGYLYDQYRMQVIGFLEEDSRITTPQKYMILDQAILMPSFQVDENTVITDGLKIHYANKTSGLAVLSAGSWKQDFRRIKEMLEDSGAGKYSFGCSPLSANFEIEYGITLENGSRLMWIAEAVCVGIVFLCLCKLCGRHNGNINTMRIMILVFAASTVIFMIIRHIGHEFWGGFNHVAVPVLLNGMLLAVSLPGIRKVCRKKEE